MDSPRERVCPSCSAPTDAAQRWCLECGHELPGARRAGLRPAVGIATTLAVLVGAASAGGYTLLQDGKKPPPPATTVAQAPPATTPETLPPATDLPATPAPGTPSALPETPSASSSGGAIQLPGQSADTPSGGTSAPSTPSVDGSVEAAPEDPASTTPPPEPQLALTDIALGAAAVVYAPYAPANADLGDPSRAVDGSTRTVWKAPAAADPTVSPQIGLYVDLASKERVRKLVVKTPTPGMGVEIYGATSGPPAAITDPGWVHLADRSAIGEETAIKLPDRPLRYVLVWITAPPTDGARPAISELSLLSMQPE